MEHWPTHDEYLTAHDDHFRAIVDLGEQAVRSAGCFPPPRPRQAPWRLIAQVLCGDCGALVCAVYDTESGPFAVASVRQPSGVTWDRELFRRSGVDILAALRRGGRPHAVAGRYGTSTGARTSLRYGLVGHPGGGAWWQTFDAPPAYPAEAPPVVLECSGGHAGTVDYHALEAATAEGARMRRRVTLRTERRAV